MALDESVPINERSKAGDITTIDYWFSVVSPKGLDSILSTLNAASTPVDGKKSPFSTTLSEISKIEVTVFGSFRDLVAPTTQPTVSPTG